MASKDSTQQHIILWLQDKASEEQGLMTFDGRPLPKHSSVARKCHRTLLLGRISGKALFYEPHLQLYQNESGYTIFGQFVDTDESQRRLGFKAYISHCWNIEEAIQILDLASEEFDRTCHDLDLEKLKNTVSYYHTHKCMMALATLKLVSAALFVAIYSYKKKKKRKRLK